MSRFLPVLFLSLFSLKTFAQSLPLEMHLSTDGHQLLTGGRVLTGLYNDSLVRDLHLDFPQTGYWATLKANFNSKTPLAAKMTFDGTEYDSVGVRFKGATSYSMVSNSDKKSFNIETDVFKSGQDVKGYSTLNLNNSYEDPSFMREVLYQHCIRPYIPTAKSNYVHLYINGADWGLYPNVQQLNGDYLKEWFLSKKGTNWRADRPDGSGGGMGGGWGDGTAAINYLGDDTATYQKYYQLHSTYKADPWQDLIATAKALSNVTETNWESTLAPLLDIDRTLWFLAAEIAFADDDSYVFKGKMDYFCYWEAETGRLTPLEYDGNSAFYNQGATWSAFYNANKANYPLLYKLLAIPELRQRYLAHLRTILEETLNASNMTPLIDEYFNRIDALVSSDPKKLYTYANFKTEVAALKTWVNTRNTNLNANTEVKQSAPEIQSAAHFFNGNEWATPSDGLPVTVRASIASGTTVDRMDLFYATGLVGNFTKVQMLDDGLNDDGAAGDGIFGASIPGAPAGEWVRYYVRLTAANTAKSVKFMPAGAEHNVFIYRVLPPSAGSKPVVINEIMADNQHTAKDEKDQYEDWIELFNPTAQTVDISGYYLTDNLGSLDKWQIPSSTVVQPGEYLIFWADEDKADGPRHCSFKLSAGGEQLFLLDAAGLLVDEVSFGPQAADLGWARSPNGYGDFKAQGPTFAGNNDIVGISETEAANEFAVYPNPASGRVFIQNNGGKVDQVRVFDALGRVFHQSQVAGSVEIEIENWPTGMYFVQIGSAVKKLMVE